MNGWKKVAQPFYMAAIAGKLEIELGVGPGRGHWLCPECGARLQQFRENSRQLFRLGDDWILGAKNQALEPRAETDIRVA